MPHRRSHRKSHNGCQQCKKRRVKCDETLPICKQCTRRETPCSFQVVFTGNSPESGESPPTFASTGIVDDSMPEYQQERKLELKLFHHFATSTSLDRALSPEKQHLQQVIIPNISLSHSYLFHSILAKSALHLHVLEPSPGPASRFWLQTALCYQQRVLVGLATVLSNITNDNVQAAAITAMNVIVVAIGLPGAQGDSRSYDPVGEVLSLRNLIQGTQFILAQSEAQLRKGELAPFFHEFYERGAEEFEDQGTPSTAAEKDDDLPMDPKLYDSVTRALERLQTTISTHTSEHQASFASATSAILEPMRTRLFKRSFCDLSTDIIGWPMKLHPQFFASLGNGDALSRVVLLHYGMALHLIRDWHWFLKGTGSRLVTALLDGFKESEAREWSEVIDWAREAVGVRPMVLMLKKDVSQSPPC